MGPVTLAIPARPEFVGVVRLAVTSLARELGLDEERVDDLKIAVSEACTNVMPPPDGSGAPGQISMAWDAADEAATVEIAGAGAAGAAEPSVDADSGASRYSFSNDLLETLMDGYEIESGPDGSTVRLRVARR